MTRTNFIVNVFLWKSFEMSIIGTIHEDVTTDVLGYIGCWQWLITFISTTLMIPPMLNQYEDMLLLKPSKLIECDVPDKSTISNFSLCTYTVLNSTNENVCRKWNVKFLWVVWIKKTWLVFCDQEIKLLSTTMICRLGIIFGCIIFGLISDSFGRKRSIILAAISELGFRIMLTFCDMESWFNLLIFLRSLFTSANIFMGLVLICEIASSTWRTSLNIITSIPRLLALICLVPLANSAPNLETYNFIICIFDVLLVIVLRWTPESPQWLLFNRKISQAEKILVKAAKINGIKLCSDFKIRPVNHRAYHSLDENQTCVGMLTTHNIRILSVSIVVFWGLYQFLWSSLYIRIFFKNNQYTLLGVLTIVAFLSSINCCLSRKLKLKSLLVTNLAFISFCNILLICMEWSESKDHTIHYIITSISLATAIIVYGLILNITPRLFAINIRCTLFGCCHSAGQLGTIVCYIMVAFHATNEFVSVVMETVVAIGLLILCYMLPDVDGRELPDVIEDMDYFSDLSKPLRWATQKTNSTSHEELEIRVYSFGSAGPGHVSTADSNQPRPPARRIGLKRHLGYLSVQGIINMIRNKFHKK